MSAIIKTAKVSLIPRALDRESARQKPEAATAPSAASPEAAPLNRIVDGLEHSAEAATQALEAEFQRAELAKRQQAAEKRGYDEGRALAQAQSERQRQDEHARIAAVLEGLEAEIARYKSRLEDGIVEVVFEALLRILGDAMAGAEGVAALVRRVVEEHGAGQDEITVRLSPADLALLGEEGCEAVRGGLHMSVKFEPDAKLSAGGCLIDMPSGSLDARLELQLERMKNALLEARKSAR